MSGIESTSHVKSTKFVILTMAILPNKEVEAAGFLLCVAPLPPVLRLFSSKNNSADVLVNQYAK